MLLWQGNPCGKHFIGRKRKLLRRNKGTSINCRAGLEPKSWLFSSLMISFHPACPSLSYPFHVTHEETEVQSNLNAVTQVSVTRGCSASLPYSTNEHTCSSTVPLSPPRGLAVDQMQISHLQLQDDQQQNVFPSAEKEDLQPSFQEKCRFSTSSKTWKRLRINNATSKFKSLVHTVAFLKIHTHFYTVIVTF